MGNATAAEVTLKIMVAAIIILFLVVILVLFLHLYAKWFWWRTEEEYLTDPREARRRRRFLFTPGQVTALVKLGLDSSVLRLIDVVVVGAKEFANGLECAVCLSELKVGEKARMLPKCKHGFHVVLSVLICGLSHIRLVRFAATRLGRRLVQWRWRVVGLK